MKDSGDRVSHRPIIKSILFLWLVVNVFGGLHETYFSNRLGSVRQEHGHHPGTGGVERGSRGLSYRLRTRPGLPGAAALPVGRGGACPVRLRPRGGEILRRLCGRLERDALDFQRAILEKLEGDTPVLGVVREGFPGWTKAVAAHPNVVLVAVTEDNRDALPELIRARLRGE